MVGRGGHVVAALLAIACAIEEDTTSLPSDTGTRYAPDSAEPADADGDGHDALDRGGDDCDDANAHVYPGAPDYCDAVDQDCDGAALPAGSCGDPIAAEAAQEVLYHDPARIVQLVSGVVGDITGDDVDDLVILWSGGQALVFAGGPLEGYPRGPSVASAWHHYTEDTSGMNVFQTVVDARDIDGDGWNDLAMPDNEGSGIPIYYGPIDGPAAESRFQDPDDWGASYALDPFSWSVRAGGTDYDGDGRADLVALNSMQSTWNQDRTGDNVFELYLWGRWSEPCHVLVDAHGGRAAGGDVATLGDGDGDGLPELGLRAEDRNWVVPGHSVRDLCWAYLDDVAAGWIPVDGVGSLRGSPGDWDGDGKDEFAATTPHEDRELGEPGLFFFSTASGFGGEFAAGDAIGSYLAPRDGNGFGTADFPDFDGDGVRDLAVADRFYASTYLLRGGELPDPASELPKRHLEFVVARSGYSICAVRERCSGDFDGDGFDDLLASQPGEDSMGWTVGLIQGFDVPWGDDAAW
jgi:hypothetical protein